MTNFQGPNMNNLMNGVAVKQLPDALNPERMQHFFRELESFINVDRPRIVLDCSGVRRMDSFALHLLLCCLEEAMKRNGDVRLAALSEEAKAALSSAGVRRLFDVFDTTSEAVSSFRRNPLDMQAGGDAPQTSRQPSGNAA
jgi:anti-anti-sigma factor